MNRLRGISAANILFAAENRLGQGQRFGKSGFGGLNNPTFLLCEARDSDEQASKLAQLQIPDNIYNWINDFFGEH